MISSIRSTKSENYISTTEMLSDVKWCYGDVILVLQRC